MADDVQKITCKFIGDFEVADNIVRNGDSLCKLSTSNENGVFNKFDRDSGGFSRRGRTGATRIDCSLATSLPAVSQEA
jgi:hypothetical protein